MNKGSDIKYHKVLSIR